MGVPKVAVCFGNEKSAVSVTGPSHMALKSTLASIVLLAK
jgi:hypothetical protein